MNKSLIIIGGNSRLAQDYIIHGKAKKKYEHIYLFSHRKYEGIEHLKITSFYGDNAAIMTEISNILEMNSNQFDVLLCNSPPTTVSYNDLGVISSALLSLLFLCNVLQLSNIRKVLIMGSIVSLIPIIRKSYYKTLKIAELRLFVLISKHGNISYCILPPLSPGTNGITNMFSQPRSFWSSRLDSMFSNDKKLYYPDGFIGFIYRSLFKFNLLIS